MNEQYTQDNLDELHSDIEQAIEDNESQESVEQAVNELFARALDVISAQEDPVAFVQQLQFDVLHNLNNDSLDWFDDNEHLLNLDDVDSSDELLNIQYLSELNDEFQKLTFQAVLKKLNITKHGDGGSQIINLDTFNLQSGTTLYVEIPQSDSTENFISQNANMLRALSEISNCKISFSKNEDILSGLASAYYYKGIVFRPNFIDMPVINVTADEVGNFYRGLGFPLPGEVFKFTDGPEVPVLVMQRLITCLNKYESRPAWQIEKVGDNQYNLTMGEEEFNLSEELPSPMAITYADFQRDDFNLPRNLSYNTCENIFNLFQQCQGGNMDPRVITRKMNPYQLGQYSSYLSSWTGVDISVGSKRKLVAKGPFFTPHYESVRRMNELDYANQRSVRILNSISFHPGDINQFTGANFGLRILVKPGVNSENVFGDLATFSHLAHNGSYDSSHMFNVPFSNKPLDHVRRETFRHYAQNELGYDPARREIHLDEPVMIRVTSGTINVPQEKGADQSRDTSAPQLQHRLDLTGIDLSASDFNAETGYVKTGRFEFIRIDMLRDFLRGATLDDLLAQQDLMQMLTSLQADVATEEIRDDLLEEIAEGLNDFLTLNSDVLASAEASSSSSVWSSFFRSVLGFCNVVYGYDMFQRRFFEYDTDQDDFARLSKHLQRWQASRQAQGNTPQQSTEEVSPPAPEEAVEETPSIIVSEYDMSSRDALSVPDGTHRLELSGTGGFSNASLNSIKGCDTLQTIQFNDDFSFGTNPRKLRSRITRLKQALRASTVSQLLIPEARNFTQIRRALANVNNIRGQQITISSPDALEEGDSSARSQQEESSSQTSTQRQDGTPTQSERAAQTTEVAASLDMSNLDLSSIGDNTTRLTLSNLTSADFLSEQFIAKLGQLSQLRSIKVEGAFDNEGLIKLISNIPSGCNRLVHTTPISDPEVINHLETILNQRSQFIVEYFSPPVNGGSASKVIGFYGANITGIPEGYDMNDTMRIDIHGSLSNIIDLSVLTCPIWLHKPQQMTKIKAQSIKLNSSATSGATQEQYESLIENMNAVRTSTLSIMGQVPSGVTVAPSNYFTSRILQFNVTSLTAGGKTWPQRGRRQRRSR